MIRFYYVLFIDEMYSMHTGYTSNWVHFCIFIKDRLPIIKDHMDNDPESVVVGAIDAENSAIMITKVLKKYPNCYELSGASEIYCYTLRYNDRPCCFTDTEMEIVNENSSYYTGFPSVDGYDDMAIFDSMWKLFQTIQIYVKDPSIREFVRIATSHIGWYMVIILNLVNHSSTANEFSKEFIEFVNDVFPHRTSKMEKLGDKCYEDFHDTIVDYYRNIIGEPTVSEKDRQAVNFLYEQFLNAMADDRR